MRVTDRQDPYAAPLLVLCLGPAESSSQPAVPFRTDEITIAGNHHGRPWSETVLLTYAYEQATSHVARP